MNSRFFRCVALSIFGVFASLAQAGPTIGGCPIFPANNVWNVPVDTLPVHASSTTFVNTIGASAGLHMDFGSGLYQGRPIGIPFITVPGTQPKVPITFDVTDESDLGPYPIPTDVPVEGGAAFPSGDRHILIIDRGDCKLYEASTQYACPGRTGSGTAAPRDVV